MLHRGAASTLLILTLLLLSLALPSAAQAETRVALVIGNSNYRHYEALPNTKNDAKLMAQSLKKAGFELVGDKALIDLDKAGTEEAISKFGNLIRGGGVALFYYSGHGVQVDGLNYLVPVGANVPSKNDIKYQLVQADFVLDEMKNSGTATNILILDACRNNPFGWMGARSGGGGLAQINAPKGTFIAYATAPGSTAADGDRDNSPYTEALAKHLLSPNTTIHDVFARVRQDVDTKTGGSQIPWEASSLYGAFYFLGAAQADTTKPQTQTAPTSSGTDKTSVELRFWESTEKSGTAEAYKAYLAQYPSGQFAALAKVKVEEFKAKQQQAQPAPAAPAPMAQAPTQTSSSARFSKDASGVITDKQTGLKWYLGPNQKMNWNETVSWANSLSAVGGGWRLPTRSELAGLRKQTMQYCFHDKIFDVYELSDKDGRYCPWVWSGETRDSSSAWLFTFFNGKEHWDFRDYSNDSSRAFAVRSRR